MDFSDRQLMRLATTQGRAAMFSQDVLAQFVSAAFDTAVAPLQGPYAFTADTVDLGLDLQRGVTLDGQFRLSPGAAPGEWRGRVAGLASAAPLRVDALLRGTLVARNVTTDSVIQDVSARFAALDLDRAIIAAAGALPAGAALEAARRAELLARLRQGAAQPDALDDAALDAVLAAAGVADVAGLLAARGGAAAGSLRVRFSAPPPGAVPVPISLPVTAAAIVAPPPLHLSDLFARSRSIRAALADDPAVEAGPAPLRRRFAILVVWVVPSDTFDDPDWPGADAAARRADAAALLTGQGIGLVTE